MREAERGDSGVVPVELAQSLFIEAVPDVDVPIGAARRECIVDGVEAYRIHWVDFF